jgi:putative hydrolase of the HAD superfamily
MFSTPLKALTFDVGGTLIAPWPSVGDIYAEAAAAYGYAGLAPKLLNQRFVQEWRAIKDFEHSRGQWVDLVDAVFHGLIERPPSRTFFAQLYERFAEPTSWRIFEDVLPTLNTLRTRGFGLGIISNWDERLRPLLHRLNLLDYFESIVISCEVGASKPSRNIFDRAANQLAVPPAAVLHVGDSLKQDVQGAQAAGFASVWLDRKANSARPGAIPSLHDLLELLEPDDR